MEDCYEPVSNFVKDEFERFGINYDFYSSDFNENIKKLVKSNTKLIYLESPTSLNYKIQDIAKFVKFARRNRIVTVMDNTWSTVIGCNPLELGIDIVIESATKYFSGHSDAMGGSLAVNKKVFKQIMFFYKLSGYRMSSDEAYLIIRGLRTLDTRLNQHYENTKQIINFLKKQKKVKEILYPYNPSSKNYKLWKKYYSGATGLLSIVVKSKKKSSVIKFVNSLQLFGIGYSWGGFESLAILQELRSNKKDEYLQVRKYFRFSKDEHIVRLHIGLEDPKDLINDLKKSLSYIK